MRKIILSLAVLALSLFIAKPALAQTAVAVDLNGALIMNDNFGAVCDFTNANANTGENSVDEEGNVTSGIAFAGTDASTSLNSTNLTGSLTDEHDGLFAFNDDTEDEDALAVEVDANLVGVINFNRGFVKNNSIALANSGLNNSGEESNIDSGAAGAGTETATELNTNTADVTITDMGDGPVAYNSDGDDEGLAIAADVNAALVLNANMGDVCNFSVAGANSGMNVSGEESEITTGGALATTDTTTGLNSNTTDVAITNNGSMGSIAANVDFDESSVAVGVDANVALVFNENQGKVKNLSFAGANSGMNGGDEESVVTTGSATAGTTASTTVNTNKTSVTITDNSNGPVAMNTEDCSVNPCRPQIPNPCETGCETGCEGITVGGPTNGPVAANIDTDGGVSVAVNANVAVVSNDNVAGVSNVSIAMANTGLNGSGEESTVLTGNAVATTGTTNTVNGNDTTVAINDGTSSGPVAVNKETEGGVAVSVDANVVAVTNDNTAVVSNVSSAVANTGNNGDAAQNATCTTGCDEAEGGSVTTGDATATTTTTNTVNSNTTTFTINH